MRSSTHGFSALSGSTSPGPRQRAICQSHQPLGDAALRAVETSQKYTGRIADTIGDHRALLQLKFKRSADKLLWHLKQLLSKRYQLFDRQSAMSLIHGLGQRVGNPRANPHHGRLLDSELHGDRISSGLEADAADIARAADTGFPP